jgi:hypothetical protein
MDNGKYKILTRGVIGWYFDCDVTTLKEQTFKTLNDARQRFGEIVTREGKSPNDIKIVKDYYVTIEMSIS